MYTVKNQKPGAEKALRILNGIARYFKAAKRILQKFEKSLKKWLTKGDGSSIISKLSHDSGQPKGRKSCFRLKGCWKIIQKSAWQTKHSEL